jgi:hypothetical protein
MTTYADRMNTPHALYRLYDKTGVLLYLGCSMVPFHRIWNHLVGQPWRFEIVRIELEWRSDWLAGRQAEMAAINIEVPRYNKLIHNPDTVGLMSKAYVATCTPKTRLDGFTCPKCGGPKPHKPGLAYCRPCTRAYKEERRRALGTLPKLPPSVTCPRCEGIKEPGPAYCKKCKSEINKAYRELKARAPR